MGKVVDRGGGDMKRAYPRSFTDQIKSTQSYTDPLDRRRVEERHREIWEGEIGRGKRLRKGERGI